MHSLLCTVAGCFELEVQVNNSCCDECLIDDVPLLGKMCRSNQTDLVTDVKCISGVGTIMLIAIA